MTLRIFTAHFGMAPAAIIPAMKVAGFKIEHEFCPVKFAKPWAQHITGDGVIYYQWDAGDPTPDLPEGADIHSAA